MTAITIALVYKGEKLSILAVTAACGALGGFISALSRLYRLTELPALLLRDNLKLASNVVIVAYALVPPLVGAAAATGLYLIFEANLLSGQFFPAFTCSLDSPAIVYSNCDHSFKGFL